MSAVDGMGWVQWAQIIAVPAYVALCGMLWRHMDKDDRRSEQTHARINEVRGELQAFRLEVAREYATLRLLERLESRFEELAQRIERRLDELARRRIGDYHQNREPAE